MHALDTIRVREEVDEDEELGTCETGVSSSVVDCDAVMLTVALALALTLTDALSEATSMDGVCVRERLRVRDCERE